MKPPQTHNASVYQCTKLQHNQSGNAQ